MRVIARTPVDLIIADYRMPGLTGLDLLAQLRRKGYKIPVIIMTGYSSIEHAVMSIKSGAIDYLTKPIQAETLEIAVPPGAGGGAAAAGERDLPPGDREDARAAGADRRQRGVPPRHGGREHGRRVSRHGPAPGRVGHRQGAVRPRDPRSEPPRRRAVHHRQLRGPPRRPGRERAVRPREGGLHRRHRARRPAPSSGPTAARSCSTRSPRCGSTSSRSCSGCIQEQEFERVGGHQPIQVDVRLIATTNRDLKAEVDAGRFRGDLYYRLNVVPIRTPSLRERMEDIPAPGRITS